MKNFTLKYLTIFFVLFSVLNSKAQIDIYPPSLGFTSACAGELFNEYNVNFSFSNPGNLGVNNQFIIELSDATGAFSNPTVVYTSAIGEVVSSPANLKFSIPTNTSGESYRVRIKSTDPVAQSNGSTSFPAYYKAQDTPFTINNFIDTGVYCAGGSYLLTIDNPGVGENDSPLQYPSLTFNWYKEISQTTFTLVATGNSLAVSEPGTYFAETNYGSCTSSSYSNRVTVTEFSSNVDSSISSSLGTSFCAGDGPTTLSAINGQNYQWYKDGVLIAGATNQTYVTSESGVFSVDIDLGFCSTSASITIDGLDFTSSINVLDLTNIEANETLVATVTTTADTPEFKWYLNDVLISGAISNTYEVTQAGMYKVEILQTVGCLASKTFLFEVTVNGGGAIDNFPDVANIPNVISPNGDGINDTWVIPRVYVNNSNTTVTIVNSQGKVVFETDNYLNNWPESQLEFKSVNPVYYYIITSEDGQTKKGSITVVK
ncbi:T9SS type B sorting domain-containing protein [Oceanihabitans sp. IOP_32]|uniref:T9SS type B sorting domain-containing protein n=1 Tax=Oceanihabitans sp. IOP_32 TaxID=2529032 RepID=UPI001293458C|nr:gliding motility-associated C-terminal domain-containing protein [Oceanihabitans sp. IOP_32]QFZ55713.1 T9SS type B sorting domain-containing protein [Oceanihabitans sp. IOP_32]